MWFTERAARPLAGLHAAYLIGTGVWPLLDRESFERISGRKQEFWLVRTVGGLAALCGVVLLHGVARGRVTPEQKVLAAGQAIVFAAADAYATARVSRVYAGDIAVQAALLPSWFVRWRRA